MGNQPRSFILARPDEQDGLTLEMEPGAIPERYLNRYHADYDVRCAFCPTHTPHRRGFTVAMADGRTALCGIDCAAKYFGVEVAARHEADLEKHIKKVTQERLVVRALSGVQIVVDELERRWLRLEEAAEDVTSELEFFIGHSSIARSVNDQGVIEVTDTVRRWVEVVGKNGELSRRPSYETKIICRVQAASVLFSRQSKLLSAYNLLNQMKLWSGRTDFSDTDIEKLSHMRTNVFRFLEQGIKFLNECFVFFTEENIKALEKFRQRVSTSAKKIIWRRKSSVPVISIKSNEYETLNMKVPDLTVRPTLKELIAPLRKGEVEMA
ncbi:MAG: hypothetical protein IIC03_02725 [Proteobacteria bacterium]|nr:hypothetical protein [Pseudomonadota bacterium]